MPIRLTVEDIRSPTWRRLTQALEERLQSLRELNDSPTKDAVQTASIRGAIREIKHLLAMPSDIAGVEESPDPFGVLTDGDDTP